MIEAELMHGVDYDGMPELPIILSKKLNGVRAAYKNGKFWSKTGELWGCIKHIQPPQNISELIDGELYVPGWSLQRIMSAAARNAQNADTGSLQFHAFDIAMQAPAINRKRRLSYTTQNEHYKVLDYYEVNSQRVYEFLMTNWREQGEEGAMVLFPGDSYRPGKHGELLKLVFFKSEEYVITSVEEGKGKLAGHIGAVWAKAGRKKFKVGTFQIGFPVRKLLLKEIADGTHKMRVQYKCLSEDGIPLNSSVEAIWCI